jgi:hypothetical protein
MASEIRPVPDSPQDEEPETVATPEGDNEYAPDQPLTPVLDGSQNPRGSEPDEYRQD